MVQVHNTSMENNRKTDPVKVHSGLETEPVIPVLARKMVRVMAPEPVNAMEPDQKAVQKAKAKVNPL
jgi:hypothetical protein